MLSEYRCLVCGWVYQESEGWPGAGIKAGTMWEDIPADFVCPVCGAGKDQFEKV